MMKRKGGGSMSCHGLDVPDLHTYLHVAFAMSSSEVIAMIPRFEASRRCVFILFHIFFALLLS